MSIGVCVCLLGFLRDLTQNCSYSKEKQSTFKTDLATPPIHTQPPLWGDILAVGIRSTQPQQPCKQNQLHKKRLLGVGKLACFLCAARRSQCQQPHEEQQWCASFSWYQEITNWSKSPEADKCTIVANLLVKRKLVTLRLVFRCCFFNLVHKDS